MSKDTITIPEALQKEKILEKHGDKRRDFYYWMRERENPEVRKYLEAENAYTWAVMGDSVTLQEEIYGEIVSRINPREISVPYELNGYIYRSRYDEGKEYPIHLRKRKGQKGSGTPFLDINKLAEKHEYYDIGGMAVSHDNKWLAFSVDTLSRRVYTIYFKNLETGEILKEKIINTTGHCTWAADNKTVYFTTRDETLRPDKVWRYSLGDKAGKILVYEEKDPTFITFVYKSKSRDFIFIGNYSTLSHEYLYLRADDPAGEFTIFQKRQADLEYTISHAGGDKFYIHTNQDALNFKLMSCKHGDTSITAWQEVIPHREEVLLEGIDVFHKFIVLSERKKGLSQVRIIHRDNPEKDYYLEPDDEVYVIGTAHNAEFVTDTLTVAYQSMVQPPIFYSYNMHTAERKVLKKKEIPNYEKSLYDSERVWATADDGTRIPLSLVYKKGIVKDGNNPVLLYGYGSYGHSLEPSFSSNIVSLLDRGFIFARAHIRGGSEMGRSWYEEGKLLQKKNTFTDFIACANALIDDKYTSSAKLTAMGGSAGGLLIGAVVNMAPKLFRALIAAVPFVDVVTTMLDTSIPLTTGEYDEWGNPEEKEFYDYIKSYSPYDNVVSTDYPAMLVTTGFHDSQVQYWEPAKWVAKIRDMHTGSNPILLHTNMDAGHSGTTGRYKMHRETAMQYAFLVKMIEA